MKILNKINGTNKIKLGIIFLIFINLLAVNASADGMLCGTLSDLEKMFAANATTPPDVPPAFYIISKVNYDIIVNDDFAETSAVYDIEILTDDWVKIRLINGKFAIKNARIDGTDTSLFTERGMNYLILNNKKGKHKLQINFLVEVNEDVPGDSKTVKLADLPETSISTLRIEIPEKDIGIEIEPSFGQGIEESFSPDKTIATATLVSGSGFSVVWHPKREKIIKEKLPAKVYAEVNSLVSVGEGVMKCYSVIDYSIAQGSAGQFRVQVPAGVSVLEVTDLYGNPVKDYKIDNNIILIQTPYDITRNYKIILNYEKDMGGTSAVSSIPGIKVLDVERETGYIGIEARTNVEISVVESSGAARVDVNELPQDIWSRSKNPLLFGYKYLKHPYSVTLDIKKHEDIPVLVAAVDYAEIITLFTEDEKSITKATYYVKNNRKQFLEVTLPKDSEIWSAFVSGAPVKPARDNESGTILIPLSRSQGYEGSLYAFPVEFVYISNIPGFGKFGKNDFEIPSVDIPVSQLNLLLYLPEDYDFIKFEGDLEEVDYFIGYKPGISLSATRPAATISQMQASNVGDENIIYEAKEDGAKIGAKVNAEIQQVQQDILEATEKGILPVRINIPQSGKAYTFTKLLVVEDKKLNVGASYIDSGIHIWIGRIVLLFILFTGFYAVRGMRNLRGQLIKILLIIIVPSIISYFLSGVWYYATFGWVIVIVAAVVYGAYLIVRGYISKKDKTKKSNQNNEK